MKDDPLFFSRPLYSLETIWLKDGIPVENAGISYQLNDTWNRTLSLYNANLTHTGKYTCNVKLRNSIYPSEEAEAQVTVLGKSSAFSRSMTNHLVPIRTDSKTCRLTYLMVGT